MVRNPAWTEDELTVALYVYRQAMAAGEAISDDAPRLIRASLILGQLSLHPADKRASQFRHAPGLRRRIRYFEKLDQGKPLDGRHRYINVWKRYRGLEDALAAEVAVITNGVLGTEAAEFEPSTKTAEDLESLRWDETLQETERKALVDARLGQGAFRKDLIDYWRGCSVTGCSVLPLLRASHIKPWRVSNNEERLDVYNGFLLTPNLDAAFDAGFVTFSATGTIEISATLKQSDLRALAIKRSLTISLTPQHQHYLSYHRENIFRR